MTRQASVKEQVENGKLVAKDIFLATLGFYGKVYEGGVSRVKELNAKRDEQFQGYVDRGVELEALAKEKVVAFSQQDNRLNERITTLRNSYEKLSSVFAVNKTDAAQEPAEEQSETKVEVKTEAKAKTKAKAKPKAAKSESKSTTKAA